MIHKTWRRVTGEGLNFILLTYKRQSQIVASMRGDYDYCTVVQVYLFLRCLLWRGIFDFLNVDTHI